MSSIVTIAGAPIGLIDRGAGTPTLFLHGNPDSSEMWLGLIDRLQDGCRCLAPDLPGFGRSAVPPGFDCTLEREAAFVEQLLAAAGVSEPVNLVVHDFGGIFGLAWAVSHPTQVRRIAIFNTNFFSDYRWHFWGKVWRTPILGELTMATTPEFVFVQTMRQAAPRLSAEHVRRTYRNFSPAARRMALRLYRSTEPANFAGWEQRLPELTSQVPTLVLWGDQDPFIARRFAERFGGQVQHFADYSHWLPVEGPDVVAPPLRRFLLE